MKKKYGFVIALLIVAIAIMAVYIFNVKGAADKNVTLPKEMIGSWSSNSNEMLITEDGVAYWSRTQEDTQGNVKVTEGYRGHVDGYHLVFTEKCDLGNGAEKYANVQDVPDEAYTQVSEVYKVEMQGSTAFVLNSVVQDQDISIAFIKEKSVQKSK